MMSFLALVGEILPHIALSLIWSNRKTETPVDHWQSQEESTGLPFPCLICSAARKGWFKMQPAMIVPFPCPVSPCLYDYCPNPSDGLKQIQPSSRTYSTSSWVTVRQNTLCKPRLVTNKAFDLASHQLYIFVGFCYVGGIHSKRVISLSSSHMILYEFLICNKYWDSKYIYIVAYCFISSWILMEKKKKSKGKSLF